MKTMAERNFIVRADFFGDIKSNEKISFWIPTSRGVLQLGDDKIRYRVPDSKMDFEIEFNKIVKVKILSLAGSKNPWMKGFYSSPYLIMFWNPFWNRYVLNITYLGPQGRPGELFFKLKTRRITGETLEILKKIRR